MYRIRYRRAIAPLAVAVALIAVASSSGCLWAPDLAMVRKDLERQLPGVNFDKEVELTLGPVALAFARLAARLSPDAHNAGSYLGDVSRLELAVYNAEHLPPTGSVAMPERLRKMQESEGWELAVRVRGDDQVAWVLYRVDGGAVRELYVVVMDSEELVMVKAEGRLERLVARALSDSGAVKGLTAETGSI